MKILAFEKAVDPATDWGKHKTVLKEEALAVWRMQKRGFLREIAFNRNTNDAILTLECADDVEAWQVLDQLPLVVNGLVTFEIISLKPYTGYERLMR